MVIITTDGPLLTIRDNNDEIVLRVDQITGTAKIRSHISIIYDDGYKEISLPLLWNGVSITTYSALQTVLNQFLQYGSVITQLGVTVSSTFVVPAGYMLQYILFNNAGIAGTVDLGTTLGGNEVLNGLIITATSLTTATIAQSFSMTLDTTLYLTCSAGLTVDVYIYLKQL